MAPRTPIIFPADNVPNAPKPKADTKEKLIVGLTLGIFLLIVLGIWIFHMCRGGGLAKKLVRLRAILNARKYTLGGDYESQRAPTIAPTPPRDLAGNEAGPADAPRYKVPEGGEEVTVSVPTYPRPVYEPFRQPSSRGSSMTEMRLTVPPIQGAATVPPHTDSASQSSIESWGGSVTPGSPLTVGSSQLSTEPDRVWDDVMRTGSESDTESSVSSLGTFHSLHSLGGDTLVGTESESDDENPAGTDRESDEETLEGTETESDAESFVSLEAGYDDPGGGQEMEEEDGSDREVLGGEVG